MFYGRPKRVVYAPLMQQQPCHDDGCAQPLPVKNVLNGTDDNDTWHETSRMTRRADFPVSHRMQGRSDPTPESSGRTYQIMRDTSRATFLVGTRLCSFARQLEALEWSDETLSDRDFG